MRWGNALTWVALAALALPAIAAASQPEPSPIPPFLATLRVTTPDGLVDDASFGVAEDATDGFDVGRDQPLPPPPPGGAWAEAYVLADGNDSTSRLHRSLVAPADDTTWRLRADVSGGAGAVRLVFGDAGIDALPPRLALDVTVEGVTADLRDVRAFTVSKPAGVMTLDVDVRVYPLVGDPPSAPTNLSAAPSLEPGEVGLSWSAPASDGGQPLRAYEVYRADGDANATLLGRTRALAFNDEGTDAGTSYHYWVRAVNRVGPGAFSARTDALGTGQPAALDPDPAAPGERDVPLASVDADVPARDVIVPAVDAPLLAVHARSEFEDPRYYDVDVAVANGTPRHLTVYTARPVGPTLDVDLLHTTAQRVAAPAAGASAHAVLRRHADGTSELVVDARLANRSDALGAPLPRGGPRGAQPAEGLALYLDEASRRDGSYLASEVAPDDAIGRVLVPAGGSALWVSTTSAPVAISFAGDPWTGGLVADASAIDGTVRHVEVGFRDVLGFHVGAEADVTFLPDADGSAHARVVTARAAAWTVPPDAPLAVRVTNPGAAALALHTDDSSFVQAPASLATPALPTPELPTWALASVGVLALALVVGTRR